ncbi:MAG: hypothetical protein H0W88_00335 [Parachlamydiaceae bacterium]|nr:hypothetical protein [Parachlamydiaceae bacterium]
MINPIKLIGNACTSFVGKLSEIKETLFPSNLFFNKYENKLRHFRVIADKISGGGQFGEPHIIQIQKIVGLEKKLLIIDLREESHGLINGLPVSWNNSEKFANIAKSAVEIKADEQKRFAALPRICFIWAKIKFFGKKFHIRLPTFISSKSTEEDVVKKAGLEYHRIPITDLDKPTDATVDKIINLINSNPNAWLHFHCYVGKGRTTTILAMHEMLKNAKTRTFNEIIKEQKEKDGEDLLKISFQADGKVKPKHKNNAARLDFLKSFYSYCRTENPSSKSWLEWVSSTEKKST